MAVIKHGLLGQFSGAIGSVQGARWKSVSYMQGRVTSNGHSTTNKATHQRERFANCRKTLSELKSNWERIAVGRGSKKLPAWQLWVKQCANSYHWSSHFYGRNPLITAGNWAITPNIVLFSFGVDGDNWEVRFINGIPCNQPSATLFYAIRNDDDGKWYTLLSGASPYDNDFVLYLPRSVFPSGSYQVYTCFAHSSQDGRCSTSLAVDFVLSE